MKQNSIVSKRKEKRRVILVFGESENDTRSLKHLVAAMRPDLPPVETRKYPLILSKDARYGKRLSTMDKITKLIASERVTRDVISVIAHRDCDEVEPAHEDNREALLNDMRAHDLPQPVAATPAFEMEAWWFLWPDALAATRPCWNKIKKRRGDIGKIKDAKQELRRSLEPKGGGAGCPPYSESDSVKIAESVKNLSLITMRAGRSRSFEDFADQINKIKL